MPRPLVLTEQTGTVSVESRTHMHWNQRVQADVCKMHLQIDGSLVLLSLLTSQGPRLQLGLTHA